jgi:hypothetical protein
MKKRGIGNVAFGIMMLCFGLFMCWEGYSAWQQGDVVRSKKNGASMSGVTAMTVGAGSTGLGFIWCWVELKRRRRKSDDDS